MGRRTDDTGHAERGSGIVWKDWSKEAFDEARASRRLVLLDLTATWCHWCHVMDSTTYSVPEVVRLINDNFVPVRVDIDRRPDISERYNRGGFPTTAFLSDRGESVWGTTYIPPEDMARIIGAVLRAKASGEVDRALSREREPHLHFDGDGAAPQPADRDDVTAAFEDILAAYDEEHGGFGTEPKFPHPDAVDLVLHQCSLTGDSELAEMVRKTVCSMAEGLMDPVEGGVFRYSVTRDWGTPHYEKMLDTNAAFLRGCARARVILRDERYIGLADEVAGYIIGTLMDRKTGALAGSQDADEAYYLSGGDDRDAEKAPAVDWTVYAGWASEGAAALVEAGVLLGRDDWIDAGTKATGFVKASLWDPVRRLVRHTRGQDLYLFEDQVGFMSALLELIQTSHGDGPLETALALVEGVEAAFAHPEGGCGDIAHGRDGVGELQTPRRSLISNAKYARALALLGAATHRPEMIERARGILRSFPGKTVEAYGMFSAAYITAWTALTAGPASVEIRGTGGPKAWEDPLWLEARKALDPGVVVLRVRGEGAGGRERAHATICTASGCSGRFEEPQDLVRHMRSRWDRAQCQV